VQKKASELLQALEHLAIDVLARFLMASEQSTPGRPMRGPGTDPT
jgi:hypothetical protein